MATTQQGPIDRGVLSVRFFDLHLAELVAWSCASRSRVLKLRWPAGSSGPATLRLGFDVYQGADGHVYRIKPADEAEAEILAQYEAAIAASDAAFLRVVR